MKYKFIEINESVVIENNKPIIVYDFSVLDDNSYCVNNIIVHNSGCLTSKQLGVGYPMASLIYEIAKIKNELIDYHKKRDNKVELPAIVADGGMKNYSDIIKAIALGADYVMLGSILNKTIDSCGDNYFYGIKINKTIANWLFNHSYTVKKCFRGMSTKDAQKAMGKLAFKTSEGVVRYRNVEYTLNGWVENFEHYLRSALSYSNCVNIKEFREKSNIITITQNSYDRFNK